MNKHDFIEKFSNGTLRPGRGDGRRYCSSLMVDNGTLYSYGYHYPLLFKVGDALVCNDRGYSNTTSKHIGVANQYATYRVHLHGRDFLPAAIIEEAKREINENMDQIERSLDAQIKRPRYFDTYQRRIVENERRVVMLTNLINAAQAAIDLCKK